MKKTLLATTLMTLAFSVSSQDNLRMIVTHKDGTQEVVTSSVDAQDYAGGDVQFENDLRVSTPDITPSRYRKGDNLSQHFYAKMLTLAFSSTGSAKGNDYVPNDEFFSEQIHWFEPEGSDVALNSVLPSVQTTIPLRRPVIGIIDSGFYEHPDLIYADGYSFTTVGDNVRGEDFYIDEKYNGSPEDRITCSVHGTGVAGVAAATRDNTIGFSGIVDADLIVARSMDCGGGFLSDTSDSILWQIGENVDGIRPPATTVDAINVSLGGKVDYCPNFMENAINKASEAGVPVVVAIGNHNIDASGFTPANCKNSISVAAATREGDLFPTSNFGPVIDIAALGEDIASATEYPDGIGWWEESSFATPIVTGVITNVVSEHENVTVDEIKFFLSVTAMPFAAGQCDDSNRCGAGILDADAFSQAVRDYKNEETAVLKPAMSNTELCDKTLYITDDNERARLCQTFELILPEHQSNRDDIRYEILSFEKGTDMAFDKGTLALTATSNKLLVSTLDTENFDYGVRLCNSERCFGSAAVKINDKSSNLPAICKD